MPDLRNVYRNEYRLQVWKEPWWAEGEGVWSDLTFPSQDEEYIRGHYPEAVGKQPDKAWRVVKTQTIITESAIEQHTPVKDQEAADGLDTPSLMP